MGTTEGVKPIRNKKARYRRKEGNTMKRYDERTAEVKNMRQQLEQNERFVNVCKLLKRGYVSLLEVAMTVKNLLDNGEIGYETADYALRYITSL